MTGVPMRQIIVTMVEKSQLSQPLHCQYVKDSKRRKPRKPRFHQVKLLQMIILLPQFTALQHLRLITMHLQPTFLPGNLRLLHPITMHIQLVFIPDDLQVLKHITIHLQPACIPNDLGHLHPITIHLHPITMNLQPAFIPDLELIQTQIQLTVLEYLVFPIIQGTVHSILAVDQQVNSAMQATVCHERIS